MPQTYHEIAESINLAALVFNKFSVLYLEALTTAGADYPVGSMWISPKRD
jgi:hypothetical protein